MLLVQSYFWLSLEHCTIWWLFVDEIISLSLSDPRVRSYPYRWVIRVWDHFPIAERSVTTRFFGLPFSNPASLFIQSSSVWLARWNGPATYTAYVMRSEFNGSHFSLHASQLNPQNDWTEWHFRVNNNDIFVQTIDDFVKDSDLFRSCIFAGTTDV